MHLYFWHGDSVFSLILSASRWLHQDGHLTEAYSTVAVSQSKVDKSLGKYNTTKRVPKRLARSAYAMPLKKLRRSYVIILQIFENYCTIMRPAYYWAKWNYEWNVLSSHPPLENIYKSLKLYFVRCKNVLRDSLQAFDWLFLGFHLPVSN